MPKLEVESPKLKHLISTARELRDPHRALTGVKVSQLAPKKAEAQKASSVQTTPQTAEAPKPQELKFNQAPDLNPAATQTYEQCAGTLTLLSVLFPQAGKIIKAALEEQQALAQLS